MEQEKIPSARTGHARENADRRTANNSTMDYATARDALVDRGLLPVPITPGTKAPTNKGWTNSEPPLASDYVGAGVGIRCGVGKQPIYAIDIDVSDVAIAKQIARHVETYLTRHGSGNVLQRIGRYPSVLIPFRSNTSFTKIQTPRFKIDGSAKGAGVEILGNGQQFVAFAIHPDTRQPYRWYRGDLLNTSYRSLPALAQEQAQTLVDDITAMLDAKLTRISGTLNGQNGHAHLDASRIVVPLHAHNPVQLRRDVMQYVHNPNLSWDDWLAVGLAIKGAFGDDGFNEFDKFSQLSDKYRPDYTREVWDSLNPNDKGAGSLYYIAEQNGYERPETDLDDAQPVDDPLADTSDAQPPVTGLQFRLASPAVYERSPLCHGLFDDHGSFAFVGREKIGKTRVTFDIVAAALEGVTLYDEFEFVKKASVLLLTIETSATEARNRIAAARPNIVGGCDVAAHEMLGTLTIVDRRAFDADAEQYGSKIAWDQYIEALVKQTKPDLIVVDTFRKLDSAWHKGPGMTRNIVRADYSKMAAFEKIGRDHNCVALVLHHSSKSTSAGAGMDLFRTVNTTGGTLAAGSGTLVVADMPGVDAFSPPDDGGQKLVFGVRGRDRVAGDLLLVLQSTDFGFVSVGPFHKVTTTTRQTQILAAIWNLQNEKDDFNDNVRDYVKAVDIASATGISAQAVRQMCGRIKTQPRPHYADKQLRGDQGRGYRLEDDE